MARIRTVKPTFWGDEKVVDLSRDARLLLLGLISLADDEGRFPASLVAITGHVFPHDGLPPTKIRRWLTEIEAVGIIRLYTDGRREYGHFPKWSEHQRINRPQRSALPAPSLNGMRGAQ